MVVFDCYSSTMASKEMSNIIEKCIIERVLKLWAIVDVLTELSNCWKREFLVLFLVCNGQICLTVLFFEIPSCQICSILADDKSLVQNSLQTNVL